MEISLEEFKHLGDGHLPGYLGIEIVDVAEGLIHSRLEIGPHHSAPNGYLHAATVVALADTSCGYACRLSLPEDATGFTTVELKANFMGTLLKGAIRCEGRLVHAGRSTQVWDATVADEATGRVIAVFRCTEMVLYPRAGS